MSQIALCHTVISLRAAFSGSSGGLQLQSSATVFLYANGACIIAVGKVVKSLSQSSRLCLGFLLRRHQSCLLRFVEVPADVLYSEQPQINFNELCNFFGFLRSRETGNMMKGMEVERYTYI